MRKLDQFEERFVRENYHVSDNSVYHFKTYICTYVFLTDKESGETYFGFGKNSDEAMYNAFFQLPYSSVREGQILIDDNHHFWRVKWDCGEKVELVKDQIENKQSGLMPFQESIMVYIYKGINEDMSFSYRRTDKYGNRILDTKDAEGHIEKLAYRIMVASTIKQKYINLTLKIPKKLIKKYGVETEGNK
jgi:hypothetical protein